MKHLIVSAGILGLLTACSGTSVAGKVTDVTGTPLVGAMVTIIGTNCQTLTDDEGAFDLSCKSGEYEVAIGNTHYVSKTLEVSAVDAMRYDLGKVVLIRIPEGEGLFLFDGSEYTRMEPSYLQKFSTTNPVERAFCIDRKTAVPHRQKPGRVPLFDKAYGDWRPWKLDAKGCAYRSRRDGGQWQETYADRAKLTEQRLEFDKTVVLMEVERGEYFIADWSNGWFVQSAASRKEKSPEAKRYSGFYIKVD